MIILTRRRFLAATTALAAAGLAPMRAFAAAPKTYRALLVACTAYPHLPEKNWLIGPKNDAVLVRDFLLKGLPDTVKFAPENVALLCDETDGASASPTHENIKAALADLQLFQPVECRDTDAGRGDGLDLADSRNLRRNSRRDGEGVEPER